MNSYLAGLIAAASLVSAGHATTRIGSAELIDDAEVVAGTITPFFYLAFVGGGRTDDTGSGTADGSTFTYTGGTFADRAAAAATADHRWVGFDPGVGFVSAVPLTSVLAVSAIDHGWTPGNTDSTEFHEPFEFIVQGCEVSGCLPDGIGRITAVYVRGVDDSGPARNADDWSTVWTFAKPYTRFAVIGGDRLVGGPYSIVDGGLEGEIDALAAVPELGTWQLLLLGLCAGSALILRPGNRRGRSIDPVG